MPRICGANGCVDVPNRPNLPAPTAPVDTRLQHAGRIGYDQYGNPIGAAEWNRRQEAQNPSFLQRIGAVGTPGTQGQYQFQPILPPHLQQPYEQLYGNALNRLNQQFAPGQPSAVEPIAQLAQTRFQTETIPGIAERFTALGSGGQRSSAFQGALGAAGSGLEQNLAALRSEYGLNERNQLLGLLGMNPYNQVYMQGSEGTQGWLPGLASAAVQTGIGALTGGPAGAAAGGLLGLWNAWRNRNRPAEGQAISAPAMLPRPIGTIAPQQQQFLNDLSKRAAPGYNLSPQEVQQIQAITGGGVGAAQDFQNTFRQPKPKQVTFPTNPLQQARYAGFINAGVL